MIVNDVFVIALQALTEDRRYLLKPRTAVPDDPAARGGTTVELAVVNFVLM